MGKRGIGAKPVKAVADMKKTRRRSKPWEKRGLSRAGRVIAFIETLKITSGMHAGKPFLLRPWQRTIVDAIYATDAGGNRIKRQVLLTIPRKNGKTQIAAALALCHLVGPEAEQRGQVYSAAADRKQAALILRELVAFVRADAELSDRIIIREHSKTLEDVITGSTYEALSSDAKKAHGLNVSFAVLDELAQWPKRDLYDALTTGGAARAEPLFVVISTQSHDKNHVMSELVQYGQRVLDGVIVDETFLPVIFAAPDDADPWSEETWFACNPALGDFRSLDEMRSAAEQAKALPAREPSFRLLYLNQPVDATARFLNARDWTACKHADDESDGLFAGMDRLSKQRCILGLDLSSTTDLTALAAWFPASQDLRAWFWMPADNLEEAERRDHVPYRLWVRQGFIEATPGRAIDKTFVVHRMAELTKDYNVQFCAADRWRLDEIRRIMAEESVRIELEEFGQGWRDMGPAIDAVETAVLRRELRHPGHPVLDMCVANAVTVSDPTGARKLVKERNTGRIDGLVAATMAIGAAVKVAPKKPSVYQGRGLISLVASR
ncbi:terminase large subunit [Mesorhizobium sp. M1334]|uniref:terminase large subunit n=1 Tax=Mesorhizobium sp. M1334 TaxID=2957084 RepID=UPI0033395CB3